MNQKTKAKLFKRKCHLRFGCCIVELLSSRLGGIISLASIERSFCTPENTPDMKGIGEII